MKGYKYMAIGGMDEMAIVGNNIETLQKEVRKVSKESFDAYLDCCDYLREKPTLEKHDFDFLIEPYNQNNIEMLKIYQYEIRTCNV